MGASRSNTRGSIKSLAGPSSSGMGGAASILAGRDYLRSS